MAGDRWSFSKKEEIRLDNIEHVFIPLDDGGLLHGLCEVVHQPQTGLNARADRTVPNADGPCSREHFTVGKRSKQR
jgi:hypothetical protein